MKYCLIVFIKVYFFFTKFKKFSLIQFEFSQLFEATVTNTQTDISHNDEIFLSEMCKQRCVPSLVSNAIPYLDWISMIFLFLFLFAFLALLLRIREAKEEILLLGPDTAIPSYPLQTFCMYCTYLHWCYSASNGQSPSPATAVYWHTSPANCRNTTAFSLLAYCCHGRQTCTYEMSWCIGKEDSGKNMIVLNSSFISIRSIYQIL
jgi:hypothetical protein